MCKSTVNWKNMSVALAVSAIAVVCVEPAYAQSGGLAPVQTTLRALVQALTGTIATSLAILAVIAAGLMAFAGRLTWGFAASIILGICLIFGSSQIVNWFQSAAGQ